MNLFLQGVPGIHLSLLPSLPLYSMILTQYCHQLGKECDLKAAISIAACWDPFVSKESLENQLINRHIYTAFLTDQLQDIIIR